MKKLTAVFFVIFVAAGVLVGPGLAEKNPAAATGLIVAGVLVVIGLALVVGVFIGGVWTARTMQAGAQLAIKAQEVNDEWDAKKTAAFAGLMREGATIGRQAPGALPALPMGQGEVFSLPPLAEFGTRREWDVIDADAGDEAQ